MSCASDLMPLEQSHYLSPIPVLRLTPSTMLSAIISAFRGQPGHSIATIVTATVGDTQMLKLYVQTYAGFIIGKRIFSHDFPVGTGISVRTDRLGSIACILRGAELHLWLCVDLGIRTE